MTADERQALRHLIDQAARARLAQMPRGRRCHGCEYELPVNTPGCGHCLMRERRRRLQEARKRAKAA